MWKKKKYNIRIQLTPEDLDCIQQTSIVLMKLAQPFYNLDNYPEWIKQFEKISWKIHNKAVEINRRKG